jgi:hypothetical protein
MTFIAPIWFVFLFIPACGFVFFMLDRLGRKTNETNEPKDIEL